MVKSKILLTGASGYVGGRFLRLLEAEAHPVRCLARRPEFLRSRVAGGTEVVAGDVLDADSLQRAMDGVHAAYYLVLSMGAAYGFEETDRRAAERFGAAARSRGVQRIIYLGGLGDATDSLSPHLRSRQEVGGILRQSGVPVVEFRASIVIGSGSLSFEMIRALVERLPVMITRGPVSQLVPCPPQASVESACQGIRARLDRSLPDDGDRRLACLATKGIQGGRHGFGGFRPAARPQCRMVAAVLRVAQSAGRARGHHPLVGSYSGDDRCLLEDFAACGSAFGALLVMGELCHSAQLYDLEIESLSVHEPAGNQAAVIRTLRYPAPWRSR